MRIAIDFKNREQGEVFLNWFKEYGIHYLMESDTVHEDLPQKLFYKKVKSAKLVKEAVHYDGLIQVV